ncbi:MAG: hypothetical protein IJ341_02040 [Bacteroidales bacterium]|nr:hypothetical protein [Bacteroidales bacterium]
MSISKKVKQGLKGKLRSISLGVSGKTYNIIEIPREENKLGYTSLGSSIHLSFDNEYIDNLDEVHSIMFIEGVYAHEFLHQLSTDFRGFEALYKTLPKYENEIFHTVFNIVEDPSIEENAKFYFRGHLLKALAYSISHIYKFSPKINGSSSAFNQFLQACIQYGDGGVLKGEFTNKDAEAMFYNVLHLFDKTITCPDGSKRVAYAFKIFEMTRPLWQPIVDNNKLAEEFINDLRKFMEANGKSNPTSMSGSTPSAPIYSEDDDDTDDLPSTDKKKEYRKKIVEDKEDKNPSDGDVSESSDGNQPTSKDDLSSEKSEDNEDTDFEDSMSGKINPLNEDKEKPNNSGENSDERSHNESKSDSGSDNGSEVGDNNTPSSADNKNKADDNISKRDPSGNDAKAEKSEGQTAASNSASPPEEDGEVEFDEYEMSVDDINFVKNEISEFKKIADNEIKELKESKQSIPDNLDIDEVTDYYKTASCLNVKVTCPFTKEVEEAYNSILLPLLGGIKHLSNQFKRLFLNDVDDKEHRTSGRINIKRLSSGRMTTRMFDRRREPADKSDVCVMIISDESASMRKNNKITCARAATIGLAEVFSMLKIPTAIFGFTGDEYVGRKKYSAVHYHYLHWKNSRADRYRLLNMKARSDNFDGYSIRYATALLKRRSEKHKILIVISDGNPINDYYTSVEKGILDTANAIKEASKVADVIGVCIENSKNDVLHAMYKEHFLQVNKVDELFYQLGAKIKNKIKGW